MTEFRVTIKWLTACRECANRTVTKQEVDGPNVAYSPTAPDTCPECNAEFTKHNHYREMYVTEVQEY